MWRRLLLTLAALLCLSAHLMAQVSEADREAEYQLFYGQPVDDLDSVSYDEPVMTKALRQGATNDKVNVRPVADNNEPCKLWVILVADTQDKNIGRDDKIDNQALNKELQGIAKCLGAEIDIQNITGREAYDKRNLVKAIKAVKPAKNDIVFFSFNGHGFRWDNQKDKYPNICMMGPNAPTEGNYVLTTDIYNALIKLNARLTICFTDCCNSKIGANGRRLQDNTLVSRATSRISKKRLRQLLIHTEGSILATAANPGEYAWSFEGSGSAFTQAFIAQLRNELSSSNDKPVSWESLMDNTLSSARRRTESNGETQHGMRYVKVKDLAK